MIYITGDTHGDFDRVKEFCQKMDTSKEDILIVLGDVGLNYYGGRRDRIRKMMVEALPITMFCIHGNHEQRPETLSGYTTTSWHGGTVWVEEGFPSILFAKDGEVYQLAGKDALVIGGAYSVDKEYRLARGFGWWENEQPSAETKTHVEKVLEERRWVVDVVLTHTVPIRYEPTEVFLPFIDQSKVDKSTENWLGEIEARLKYDRWYCGHYHTSKTVDRMVLMFEDFRVFSE